MEKIFLWRKTNICTINMIGKCNNHLTQVNQLAFKACLLDVVFVKHINYTLIRFKILPDFI